MKLYLKTKNVLDEREMQEVYRIEHRGLSPMRGEAYGTRMRVQARGAMRSMRLCVRWA